MQVAPILYKQGRGCKTQQKIFFGRTYPFYTIRADYPSHPFELRFADALHSHNYKPILNTMLG